VRGALRDRLASIPQLRLWLQNGQASHDPHILRAYSQDAWPRKLIEYRERGPAVDFPLDLVVWPETVEDVRLLVRNLPEWNAELIPYGAGSGVCGATIPSGADDSRARILLDLKRLRAIRRLDEESLVVEAETGWIGENLERALNERGFTLGHFPSSIYCSSLGGYLAARSAGQLSTKYGKIEDMVLALECVLPDGTSGWTGRAPRSAMGPDWTQLLLGSEGTLAIFTAARLQIHRLPEKRIFLGFAAEQLVQALGFARRLVQDGIRPAALRIYDPQEASLALDSRVLRETGFPGGAALVVVFEGAASLVDAEADTAMAMAESLGLSSLGPMLGEHWWSHRYNVSYRQQLIASHGRMVLDTFEVASTWDKLMDVYGAVKRERPGLGVILAHFSHFYHTGANIYFTMIAHSGLDPSALDRYDSLWSDVMTAALNAGATLSHHHGVGLQKADWIARERPEWLPIFGKVKRAFDPENRFNPGKMGLA